MDPILSQALRNLAPPEKKPTLKDYKKKLAQQAQGDYAWPVDRLPDESNVDPNEPLLQSYELEVWKEMVSENEPKVQAGKSNFDFPGREGRKSPRWKVSKDQQLCGVRIGNEILPGSLIDESDGGFALVVDAASHLKVGQKIELNTYQGWCKVRIVHVKQVAPPKDAAIQANSCLRLGIKKT
jgi:hypothetical protein